MDCRYCKRCRKLYSYGNRDFCMDCQQEIDEIVQRIRDFTASHPDADVKRICEETESDERDVLQLLREGRLVLSRALPLLECEKCGKAIHNGRYCDECKKELSNLLSNAANSLKKNIETEKPARRDDGNQPRVKGVGMSILERRNR